MSRRTQAAGCEEPVRRARLVDLAPLLVEQAVQLEEDWTRLAGELSHPRNGIFGWIAVDEHACCLGNTYPPAPGLQPRAVALGQPRR